MKFPSPERSLTNLTVQSNVDGLVTLRSDESLALEVSYLANVGWSVEVRYDLNRAGASRQPFTGRQALLEKAALALNESKGCVEISCAESALKFSKSDGKFSLIDKGTERFVSLEEPFKILKETASIPDGLNSEKVVELSDHATFSKFRKYYQSDRVTFRYPLPKGPIYGLPGSTGEVNKSGHRYELYNTDRWMHYPTQDPLYQSWPILFHRDSSGSGWFGIFHDNPCRTFADLGEYHSDQVFFESIANNTRIYLITGETLADVSRQLINLLGTGHLPPLWAFGYQQCRWSYLSTDEIRKVSRTFDEQSIPLDTIYFDIDYMEGYRVFTHNNEGFADISACIDELHAAGRTAVCIIDPGVKIDEGYEPYDRIMQQGGILREADGRPFEMVCWADKSVLPDFGNKDLRKLWGELQNDWLHQNKFDGVWNDMNEPSNFDGHNDSNVRAVTARGEFRKESNLYGYYMAQTSREGWDKTHPDKRGVIITRSGYPGVQQHSIIWHGDNHAWWEHLRLAIDTCILYSLCGCFYNGPDVPGFSGNPPDDLAVRFFQLGSFLPLFRGHSAFFFKNKEPYAFSSESRRIIRDSIRLRYSLLREWYSGYERAFRLTITPVKPVLENQVLVRDQFTLFDKFVVAPVIQRDQSMRLVYLPEGEWYRLGNTTQMVEGGRWISEPVTLDSIPVFVKAGSVVTRNKVGRQTAETIEGKETFEVYPDREGNASGYWYSDDGISYNHSSARREALVWEAKSGSIARHPVA